jgi:hypothetical protein
MAMPDMAMEDDVVVGDIGMLAGELPQAVASSPTAATAARARVVVNMMLSFRDT